ncbi:MAG: Lpg1974 family pore-forming outer membrane protein [Simkaniaceae bacterium]
MNKRKKLSLIICLVVQSTLIAQENEANESGHGMMATESQPQCDYKEEPGSCPYSCDEQKNVPCNRGITFEAGPQVVCGWNLYITGDFLYWTAKEDGIAYATTGSAPQNATVSVPEEGSIRHPNESWDPGFKVGMGYNFPFDGWDIYAQYTNFNTHNSRSYSSNPQNPNNQLANIWGIGGSGIGNSTNLPPNQAINSASSKWNLDFDLIDLEIARNYYVGRCLAIRPHFGLRGSWQDQYYDVIYLTPPIGGPGVLNQWTMTQKMDYWGIGLRSGLDSSWKLFRYFSFFVNGAVSVLLSHFEVHRTDNQIAFDANDLPVSNLDLLRTRNSYYSLKGVFDFFIGLRFEKWTENERFYFKLDAGWEEQLWISQSNFFRLEENAHGDLGLHGLVIKMQMTF